MADRITLDTKIVFTLKVKGRLVAESSARTLREISNCDDSSIESDQRMLAELLDEEYQEWVSSFVSGGWRKV